MWKRRDLPAFSDATAMFAADAARFARLYFARLYLAV